jgi:hypothetical protein
MGSSFDTYNNSTGAMGLDVQVINTDTVTTGNIIDTALYESVLVIFFTGTMTAGGGVGLIQEGDDSGLSDAATSTDIKGAADMAADGDDDIVRRMGYHGSKRYIRPAVDSDGTCNGTFGAIVVLGNPKTAPTAAQST